MARENLHGLTATAGLYAINPIDKKRQKLNDYKEINGDL
jgi:hypothetical protein